jgi:RecA-family ATPase
MVGSAGDGEVTAIVDIIAKWEAEGDTQTEETSAAPLWIDATPWIEGEIQPRPWIAKGYLMRGAVSVLSGPGSAGKSSLVVAWAIAAALGAKWHNFVPVAPMKVAIYNVEDDRDEQRRRLSAALRQFEVPPAAVAKNIIRLGPNGTGTLLRRDPISGRLQITAAMKALEQMIAEHRPDALVLDPLVELHDSEENDNTGVRTVMAKFRAMAAQYNMAILLIHHARKGASGHAGDPDSLRGASSIVGAARVVLTVLTMDEEQAAKLGLNAADRHRYFRVDGAKSNYAPLHDAEWFQRIEYELDNGEGVAAAVPWEVPSIFRDLTAAQCNKALDRIDAGMEPGIYYAPSKRGGSSRWCGTVLMDLFEIPEAQAASIVLKWIDTGTLVKGTFEHPHLRRQVPSVRVDDAKRPSE